MKFEQEKVIKEIKDNGYCIIDDFLDKDNLEKIRNSLLPKLISGELRIPDVEKMIEEVGI